MGGDLLEGKIVSTELSNSQVNAERTAKQSGPGRHLITSFQLTTCADSKLHVEEIVCMERVRERGTHSLSSLDLGDRSDGPRQPESARVLSRQRGRGTEQHADAIMKSVVASELNSQTRAQFF